MLINFKIFTLDGSIFEGIEFDIILPDLKEFKYNNPGQKKREKFWDTKKESFFCSTGIAKENYNTKITDVKNHKKKFSFNFKMN